VYEAVKSAIHIGYRNIDCALVYGNEKEIGQAFKELIGTPALPKRSDLFVTSKLWNTFHRVDCVRTGLMTSLNDLGLEYIDLYLIHWPISYQAGGPLMPQNDQGKFIYDDTHYLDTWKEMEKFVDEGLVKSIGLSNFNQEQIQHVLQHGRIKPSMLQIEVNPYFSNKPLIEFAKSHNIHVTAYSSLGSAERPWAKPDHPLLLEEPILAELGKKYNKSPAQICIRWILESHLFAIPKSTSPVRLAENFNVFDFQLTAEDVRAIDSMNKNLRVVLLESESDHPFYPFK